MYVNSLGCRVNGNILVPHYNIIMKLSMKRSHGRYKRFVSCIISFGQLEIGAITGEYMVPSNYRIHMVLLVDHVCSNSIRGVGDSGI